MTHVIRGKHFVTNKKKKEWISTFPVGAFEIPQNVVSTALRKSQKFHKFVNLAKVRITCQSNS